MGKNTRNKRVSGRFSKPRSSKKQGLDILYGVHSVVEALANPKRRLERLLVTENAERRVQERLETSPITPEQVKPAEISRITGNEAVHQGIVLLAHPLAEPCLADIAEGTGPIVMLDQITDPHNVGAILRSCAAFGAAGLVITARHSPQASGVLAKSASGAIEHVPVFRATNLSNTIEELKDAGVHCIGLDSEADRRLEDIIDPAEPIQRTAIVLGAEGKGLRHKTREKCSDLARLDMPGAIASLNVSNAAVLALYVATQQSP